MKIVMISHTDAAEGAAHSAYRLHDGLRRQGQNSNMLVQIKRTHDPNVIGPRSNWDKTKAYFRPRVIQFGPGLYGYKPSSLFSIQGRGGISAGSINEMSPDVINIHWACHGFLSIRSMARLKRPVVWTLHDMWAFTGGCHYDGECGRFEDACGQCPVLDSQNESDLSRRVFKRKEKHWRKAEFTVVTPSAWLSACAKKSALFKNRRIETIPYGLDLERFRPLDRTFARRTLGLPVDRKLILFLGMSATSDERKGFPYLVEALKTLNASTLAEKMNVVVVGSNADEADQAPGMKTHYLGRLNDDISLALAYAAADVFVAPSKQDNLPNTVLEALACGIPSVAFNIGGMPDMIDHLKTGYLAQAFDAQDLAKGILWVLESEERGKSLSQAARKKAELEFPLELQAKRYAELFQDLGGPAL